MRLILAICLLGLVSPGVRAAPNDNGLQNAAKSLQDSRNQQRQLSQSQERLALQLEGLRQSLAMAGLGALSTETTLSLLNQELRESEAQAATLRTTQRRSEQQTAGLLASLQRIGLVPPLMLSYLPLTSQGLDQTSANDVVRAAILLNSSLPLLAQRTQNLQAGIVAIEVVERRILNHKGAIQDNSNQLRAKRRAIQDLLDHKARLMQLETSEYRALQRHSLELTRTVANLQALTQQLGSELRAGTATSGSPQAASSEANDPRNSRRMIPAVGKVILDWNQRDGLGEVAREQYIQVASSAMVVAPASGKVLVANPFKSYGNMLIISTRDGYLCIVAGVDRLVVSAGEIVTVGQPIGGIEASGQNTKNILFQVLQNNRPIDPNQWIRDMAMTR